MRLRLGAAKGVLDRITIVAPVKGVVVKLRYHTQGGVIEPGKNILEILPLQDELIIEGRIRPQDIDNVRRGQHAMVRLNALNHRTTPMIAGEVIYVSADVLPDEKKSPQLGPGFPTDGPLYSRDLIAVISDRLWRQRYNADPGVVGRRHRR